MSTDPHGLPYQLIALGAAHDGARGQHYAPWQHLGRYADRESVLRARVENVLEQLEGNDGWLVQTEHLVIGPGPDGPATVSSCVSSVGADPHRELVPAPFNRDAVRDWLLAAHGVH
jgi:hypothetical protein